MSGNKKNNKSKTKKNITGYQKKSNSYQKRKKNKLKKKADGFLSRIKKTVLTLCIISVIWLMIPAFSNGHFIGNLTRDFRMANSLGAVHILEDAIDTLQDFVDDVQNCLSQILGLIYSFDNLLSSDENETAIQLDSIPDYTGIPYVELNNNSPAFTKEEIRTKSYEYYSELDLLGRCGTTIACIGRDIMPTEERGAIGMVKPSGWKLKKYDIVDGKYIYNRCHLIGYQLTGENANVKNLITGTRYMNVDGMLPFENKVADYVKKTGNHVMYRVTPIFEGENLVASGVQMEAFSVEDKGMGICFNVYVYNVQPGIEIDYRTGDNWLKE